MGIKCIGVFSIPTVSVADIGTQVLTNSNLGWFSRPWSSTGRICHILFVFCLTILNFGRSHDKHSPPKRSILWIDLFHLSSLAVSWSHFLRHLQASGVYIPLVILCKSVHITSYSFVVNCW